MSKRIWCNGCFDGGLHIGHLELLKYAKSLGDILICGIDSDRRVKSRKGEGRPLRTQKQRTEDLMNTGLVSAVYLFDSDDQLRDSIHLVHPDIVVVGEEYRDKVIGSELVKEVKYFPKIEGYSTTQSIKDNEENEQWRYM